MPRFLELDFETFNTADIKTVGAWKYAEHPSLEIICLAWALDNRLHSWLPGQPLDELKTAAEDENVIFVAHNASMEQAVWHHVMVPQYGMPPIPIHRWRCSMASAGYYAYPQGLDEAAKAVGLPLGKDVEGKKAATKLWKPKKPSKRDPSTRWADPDGALLKATVAYCKQDVRAENGIIKKLGYLPAEEQRIWELDQLINQRGIKVDVSTARRCRELLDLASVDMLKELSDLTDGGITAATQTARIKTFCNERGFSVPSLDKEFFQEVDFDTVEDPKVRRVLEIRQILGKSSLGKLRAMAEVPGADGRARGLLRYYGASTGRWSGQLIQPQNMAAPLFEVEGEEGAQAVIDIINSPHSIDTIQVMGYEVTEFLVTALRFLFMSEEDKQLGACDFTSIESVILFSLARDRDKMEMLRTGKSLYVDLANKIYKRPIDKHKDPKEYKVGKIGILGLGYGMGAEKYVGTLWQQAGVRITLGEGTNVVSTYREENTLVKKLWYGLEKAAISAVADPSRPFEYAGIVFQMDKENDRLVCLLPSGRPLFYNSPRLELEAPRWKGADANVKLTYLSWKEGRWQRVSTYGGKLCENVVQAIARCLMASSMLRLEANGFPLVLTVHDENVAEKRNPDLAAMVQIMSERPAYARDWPISASGWVGRRYRK